MSVTLNNKRILITRPGHQADHLCELIANAGGECVLFPTIEIQATLNSEKLSNCFSEIDEYDFVIFVSRNAVKAAFDHYLPPDLPETIQLLAIGSGTAAVLAGMNLTNVLHAGVQADSESLLQLPELQSDFVRNKKILIVRGIGGRELLADNLKTRGAIVDYAEVYKRCLPEYEIQERHEIWQNNVPEAVIVSSNEGLENLLKLTQEADRKQLFKTPLVVMSVRNADLAKEKGFVSDIEIAKNKNDEGLLAAVLELVGDKSGMNEEKENKTLDEKDRKNTVDKNKAIDKKTVSVDKSKSTSKLLFVLPVILIVIFSVTFVFLNNRLNKIESGFKQSDVKNNNAAQDSDGRIQELLSRFTGVQKKLEELESKQEVLSHSLSAPVEQQIHINKDYALAEIEHLLIIASYNLQLEQNVATALAAMEAADARLKGLTGSAVISVREQLIADMNELRSINQADLGGLALFLSDLMNRVDQLELKENIVLEKQEISTEQTDESVKGIKHFFALVFKELKSLIVITRDKDVGKVRLLPDEVYFLGANLKLELANARFAVFNRDTENFHASIDHIQTWLNDYFDLSDANVRNIYDSLSKMKKIDFAFPDINISSSLESVRALSRYQDEQNDNTDEEGLIPQQ